MTKLHELLQLGQSIWYDNISRDLLESGALQRLIDQGLRGMTSNPTIFEQAIKNSQAYDIELASMQGKPPFEVYEALALADIRRAAELLRPVYEASAGHDGYVSLEVSPELARDTDGTIEAARRYAELLGCPNLMIKIPATSEGIPAIETCIGEGLNINATLMFSLADYDAVAGAYINGLEKLVANGGDPSGVASVASFFVSRVDSKVDPLLKEAGAGDLLGTVAVANTKLTYERFKQVFDGERWQRLADAGARVQRPLWASTSTKNPDYSDTLYVDNLIGPDTVNTVPPVTLDAILDHAQIEVTIENEVEVAQARINRLASLGIDFAAVTETLQIEGVEKFAASFRSLLAEIEQKVLV